MKKNKTISLVLAASLLVGSVSFYTFDGFEKIGAMVSRDQKDRSIAEDMASLTGYTANDIMQLKAESGSWNAAIDSLKNGLTTEKMTDEELGALLETESFSQEEISEAKAEVMQVQFNLDEILRSNTDANLPAQTIAPAFEKKDDDSAAYKKIAQAFDSNLAVYLSLKLKDKLGSRQAVIDEYLYCLQIDIDLRLYLENEKEYEKKVLEKAAELMREDAITAVKISDYVLKLLQNSKQPANLDADKPQNMGSIDPKSSVSNNNAPDHTVKNPKPQDPTQAVMDEIDAINRSWNNVGR